MILKFLYSTGARVSEVCKLKIEDLKKLGKGEFKCSKRKRTRPFKLDDDVNKELRDFIRS